MRTKTYKGKVTHRETENGADISESLTNLSVCLKAEFHRSAVSSVDIEIREAEGLGKLC